jgi:hypothetical protein
LIREKKNSPNFCTCGGLIRGERTRHRHRERDTNEQTHTETHSNTHSDTLYVTERLGIDTREGKDLKFLHLRRACDRDQWTERERGRKVGWREKNRERERERERKKKKNYNRHCNKILCCCCLSSEKLRADPAQPIGEIRK